MDKKLLLLFLVGLTVGYLYYQYKLKAKPPEKEEKPPGYMLSIIDP